LVNKEENSLKVLFSNESQQAKDVIKGVNYVLKGEEDTPKTFAFIQIQM
jgi:hypothetical protein